MKVLVLGPLLQHMPQLRQVGLALWKEAAAPLPFQLGQGGSQTISVRGFGNTNRRHLPDDSGVLKVDGASNLLNVWLRTIVFLKNHDKIHIRNLQLLAFSVRKGVSER